MHFLVSHPTPPVFDGPEDRNGRRNSDEIRFWSDYITPGAGRYIYDDEGGRGGLTIGAHFVIAGDQNSDPLDGDSLPGAIQQLIHNPRVNTSSTPDSAGAVEAKRRTSPAGVQLGGYGLLWDENFPDDPVTGGYHLVRFDKVTGGFEHRWWPKLEAAQQAGCSLNTVRLCP